VGGLDALVKLFPAQASANLGLADLPIAENNQVEVGYHFPASVEVA
jgi:hypothetical protein